MITDKQHKLLELAREKNLNPGTAAKIYSNQTNRSEAFTFLRTNDYIVSDPANFGSFNLTNKGLEQLTNPKQEVLNKISFDTKKEIKKLYVILNNFSARLQKMEAHVDRLSKEGE